jgi:hypothetical protein
MLTGFEWSADALLVQVPQIVQILTLLSILAGVLGLVFSGLTLVHTLRERRLHRWREGGHINDSGPYS